MEGTVGQWRDRWIAAKSRYLQRVGKPQGSNLLGSPFNRLGQLLVFPFNGNIRLVLARQYPLGDVLVDVSLDGRPALLHHPARRRPLFVHPHDGRDVVFRTRPRHVIHRASIINDDKPAHAHSLELVHPPSNVEAARRARSEMDPSQDRRPLVLFNLHCPTLHPYPFSAC